MTLISGRRLVAVKSDLVTRLKDCASCRKLRKSLLRGNQSATGVIYERTFCVDGFVGKKIKDAAASHCLSRSDVE